jgi:hypothetical protein
MTLPRLELTENSNKNNDFIIFRHYAKSKSKSLTKKRIHRKKKTKKRKHKKSKKGFFNIFR